MSTEFYQKMHATDFRDTPFRSSQWIRSCVEAQGGQLLQVGPDLLLVQRRIGPWLVAGLPLPKTGTPMTAGLIGTRKENDASLMIIDKWFHDNSISMLQVTSSTPPPTGVYPSRVERLQNLEINLDSSCEDLWNGMSSLPRRQIRKAVASGVKVHLSPPDVSRLNYHERVAAEIFSATGERPVLSSVQRLAMIFPPLSASLKVFSASKGGVHLGSLYSVQHADRSFYWDVAVNSLGRKSGAGHLLIWTWMRWCKRKGIALLDLMGPPEGGRAGGRPGIGRFKMAFGAKPQDYSVIYWMRHGTHLALDASRVYARVRARVLNPPTGAFGR